MNNYYQHPGNQGALINGDTTSLDAYRLARRARFEQDNKINEINNIKEEISELKNNFAEIKELLIKVLENK